MGFPIEKLEQILEKELIFNFNFFLVECRRSSLFYCAHRPIPFHLYAANQFVAFKIDE